MYRIVIHILPNYFIQSTDLTLLKIENTEVNLETERDKVLCFTKLKTYTDFKRLPEAYVLPVFNFYIGTLYVRLTTLWDQAKV